MDSNLLVSPVCPIGGNSSSRIARDAMIKIHVVGVFLVRGVIWLKKIAGNLRFPGKTKYIMLIKIRYVSFTPESLSIELVYLFQPDCSL